jgi:hypothetical protein
MGFNSGLKGLKGLCSRNTTIKMKGFKNIPAETIH